MPGESVRPRARALLILLGLAFALAAGHQHAAEGYAASGSACVESAPVGSDHAPEATVEAGACAFCRISAKVLTPTPVAATSAVEVGGLRLHSLGTPTLRAAPIFALGPARAPPARLHRS